MTLVVGRLVVGRLVVGVIGHVDHGKTALVRALTGIETDRLAEERRRGISIALGFAHLAIPGGTIDLIDMPGHERFVRTMVSGATGMAAALLVVAANEGIKPQTREHLDIAALLGVRRIVVAVSKADLDPDGAARTARAATALASGLGLAVIATVQTSAVTGIGLDDLRAALATVADGADPTADDGFCLLPVDRAFSIAGHGTVVTGTLRRGSLGVSDEVALSPGDRPVRLRGIQVNGLRVATATPGQRVAVNLRDVEPAAVPRGTVLAPRGLLAPSDWLSVSIRAVESAAPLADGMRLTLLIGTAELPARLRLLDRDVLEPGEQAVAQLHCAEPVAMPARERFILRRPSPPQTLAGGHVIDPAARRLRRSSTGDGHARLAAMANAAPAEIVAMALDEAGAAGIALPRLAQLAGLAPARVVALLPSAHALVEHGTAITRACFDAVLAALSARLAREPDPVSRERLSAFLPGTGAAVIAAAVATLVQRGVLREAAGAVRLHRPRQERDAAAREAAAIGQIAAALQRGGLAPPDLGALSAPAHRLVNRLIRDGIAIRAVDVVQKREIVFHRDAIETAKTRLMPHLARPPGLSVGEAGQVLGISRKFSVPLLEYLDAIHFTRRVADRRVLARMATAAAPPR